MDDPRPSAVSNLPEFTVSEISGAVKRTLETTFGRVRVRGEITELKRYPSGHVYLSLKDENAKIAGVIWKSSVSRLGMVPENGVEVIATGRITAYADRSTYQLIIERLEYAGAGALLARIEMLRKRLADEGLFDAERKRPLPVLPQVIGVISSERGAVIQDIRTTIARRFPRHVLLWPVPVQGDGAAEQIAAAIRGFDAIAPGGPVPRPDVLIVARGGGSLEDLMAFNEEIVVRAVAACAIPLISAVGHETDTTLIDFASDRRAPTPTAAAEMAIPAHTDLIADVTQKRARLLGALNRIMQQARLRLSRAEQGLPDLPGIIGTTRQRLEDRAERLTIALPNLVERRRAALTAASHRLPHPAALIRATRERVVERGVRLVLALPNLVSLRRGALALAGNRLTIGLQQRVAAIHRDATRTLLRLNKGVVDAAARDARGRLQVAAARLEAVSPLAVLSRGYALVTRPDGHTVTSAQEVKPGSRLRLRFADGEVSTRAEGRPGEIRQGELGL